MRGLSFLDTLHENVSGLGSRHRYPKHTKRSLPFKEAGEIFLLGVFGGLEREGPEKPPKSRPFQPAEAANPYRKLRGFPEAAFGSVKAWFPH
jgi:hypothetical protein